jgi:hypothetical protein
MTAYEGSPISGSEPERSGTTLGPVSDPPSEPAPRADPEPQPGDVEEIYARTASDELLARFYAVA